MSATGNVYVVTGGTHGIGAACVRRLAEQEDAAVVFTGRDQAAAGKSCPASPMRVSSPVMSATKPNAGRS